MEHHNEPNDQNAKDNEHTRTHEHTHAREHKHERTAAQTLEDDAKKVEEGIKDNLAEAAHSTKDTLEQDKEEIEGLIRDGERTVKEVAHDITHPKDLGADISKAAHDAVEHVEEKGEKVVNGIRSIPEAPAAIRHKIEHVEEETGDLIDYARSELDTPINKRKIPLVLKILAVLVILGGLSAIGEVVEAIIALVDAYSKSITIQIVFVYITLFIFALIALTTIFLGIHLLLNKRRFAALTINVIYVLIALGVLCSIMLYGITWRLILYGIYFAINVALQSYLDPSLREERELRRRLRDMETREQAEKGTLGLDQSGKGYITLNFFNMFWIFVVSSILGLLVETVWHMTVVDPGVYQDRAGLLFGPFSPIYGFGALLMTIFLNRFHKANIIIIFLVSAVIGGAFEYFVWWFMKFAFGATAWDYSGMWLSIGGGGTCGVFMIMWGILGCVWIKLLLPILLHVVNLIPWNWRYGVTTICAALMIVDGVMTLQSLDCWYQRLSGVPVTTSVEKFYDEHFDNSYMANRFQSMTITPDESVRGQSDTASK